MLAGPMGCTTVMLEMAACPESIYALGQGTPGYVTPDPLVAFPPTTSHQLAR